MSKILERAAREAAKRVADIYNYHNYNDRVNAAQSSILAALRDSGLGEIVDAAQDVVDTSDYREYAKAARRDSAATKSYNRLRAALEKVKG